MAQFANIAINDGQTTPVAHTFVPAGSVLLPNQSTRRWTWMDFSVNGGLPLGANQMMLDVRMPRRAPSGNSGDPMQALRADLRFVLPTLEVSSGTTAAGFEPQAKHAFDTMIVVSLVRSGRAGQAPVKDATAFMRNALNTTLWTDVVNLISPPTGG